ncbi:MBL fold metallo-hydrolase [Aeropyrum camini]|nr:MBL fold metallo-hydrolase [Aeropyrum camini]
MPFRVEAWIPIGDLGSVNVYAFTEGPTTVLVDSGMFSGKSVYTLLKGLRRFGVDPRSLERVVVTHYHVDHLTGAAILCEALGAELMLARGDLELLLHVGVEQYFRGALELLALAGTPRTVLEEIARSSPAVRVAEAYGAVAELSPKPLGEGDRIGMPGHGYYLVMETPGHTPGHIVLVSHGRRKVLLGDTVLPGITPHVSLHSLDSDPLGDYLSSLSRIAREMDGYQGLPGHGDPIKDVATRTRELIAHHVDRLGEIVNILGKIGKATAFEVAQRVRWRGAENWGSLPPLGKYLALGETLSHLRRLEVLGVVERLEAGGRLQWRLAVNSLDTSRIVRRLGVEALK